MALKKQPAEMHRAFALQPDGAHVPIDGRVIVFELPGGEIEVDLDNRVGLATGRLNVRLLRGSPLVIGPGDGDSTYLCPASAARRPRSKR